MFSETMLFINKKEKQILECNTKINSIQKITIFDQTSRGPIPALMEMTALKELANIECVSCKTKASKYTTRVCFQKTLVPESKNIS